MFLDICAEEVIDCVTQENIRFPVSFYAVIVLFPTTLISEKREQCVIRGLNKNNKLKVSNSKFP